MQFHFLWVLCGRQYHKAGIIWEEHETQRERRTLGEGGSLQEGREGWWTGILCVRSFHRRSYRKGCVVLLQGGEWWWEREMAESHKQRPGEIGPSYKKHFFPFKQTVQCLLPLLCTSTCNLWGLTSAPVWEKNESRSKLSVSDHYCSSAQMSHPGALTLPFRNLLAA